MRTFSARDAAGLAGASIRQVENFIQNDVVIPAREGYRGHGGGRQYTLRNVAEIAVATQLLDQGVPVRVIRLVIEGLRWAWPLHAVSGELKRKVLVLEQGTPSAEFGPWVGRVFMEPDAVAAWTRNGNSGVVVNIPAILERLEQETGDAFDEPGVSAWLEAHGCAQQ